MDIDVGALPYDDNAGDKYAEEHPEHDLKNRIGAGRLYLLSESSAAAGLRPRQREQHGGDADATADTMAIEELTPGPKAPGARDNAILFRGEPISKLPTARIFKYVSLSATPPFGAEWVDDENVVLVWQSASEARSAFRSMREAGTLEMEEDDEGFLPARPMPETLASVEMRLEKALGKTVQEKGQMWMRWARPEDVKAKGGKTKSKFYEKYGENAGKEGQNVFAGRGGVKTKRRGYDEDEGDRENLRRRLDAELDGFADGDEGPRRRSISPRRGRSASPSRRDHGGRSSKGRRKPSDYDYDRDLKSRLGPPVGSGRGSMREWDVGKEWETDEFGRSTFGKDAESSSRADREYGGRRDGRSHRREHRDGDGGRRREAKEPRPSLTKEELDAEMDAFLQS